MAFVFLFLFRSVDLFGFKPVEDEDVSTSFTHVFERPGVGGDEEVDVQVRVERQVALVREWGRFLQVHGSTDGAIPRSVSLWCQYECTYVRTYICTQFAVNLITADHWTVCMYNTVYVS